MRFLLAYEQQLLLTDHTPGTIPALHAYLYERTGGSIGSLGRLLTNAAIDLIASKANTEAITSELLDTITIDHTAETTWRTVKARKQRMEPLVSFS